MTRPSTFRKIPLPDLRNKFADGKYRERLEKGELSARVLSDHEPNPDYEQPPGTRSQKVGYVNKFGIIVATVHQYVLPDGRLGASGKPDPISIFDLDSRTEYTRAD